MLSYTDIHILNQKVTEFMLSMDDQAIGFVCAIVVGEAKISEF